MTVIDKNTGSTLKSNNELVVKSWQKNPQRYSPIEPAPVSAPPVSQQAKKPAGPITK